MWACTGAQSAGPSPGNLSDMSPIGAGAPAMELQKSDESLSVSIAMALAKDLPA